MAARPRRSRRRPARGSPSRPRRWRRSSPRTQPHLADARLHVVLRETVRSVGDEPRRLHARLRPRRLNLAPGRLPTVALAVLAARPAAGSAHAFLELFAGATDAALAGRLLLGVLDPADELVARQRRDVE